MGLSDIVIYFLGWWGLNTFEYFLVASCKISQGISKIDVYYSLVHLLPSISLALHELLLVVCLRMITLESQDNVFPIVVIFRCC